APLGDGSVFAGTHTSGRSALYPRGAGAAISQLGERLVVAGVVSGEREEAAGEVSAAVSAYVALQYVFAGRDGRGGHTGDARLVRIRWGIGCCGQGVYNARPRCAWGL